jgi:hypothetical protein
MGKISRFGCVRIDSKRSLKDDGIKTEKKIYNSRVLKKGKNKKEKDRSSSLPH